MTLISKEKPKLPVDKHEIQVCMTCTHWQSENKQSGICGAINPGHTEQLTPIYPAAILIGGSNNTRVKTTSAFSCKLYESK